jgi:hypothetical protein
LIKIKEAKIVASAKRYVVFFMVCFLPFFL